MFDISGAYLSEKYKQARGRSIPEQLNALRMEKAGELLRQSDLPLERIGELVGILNTSTLIRSFKKHMGVTPGAYRKNHAFAEKKSD